MAAAAAAHLRHLYISLIFLIQFPITFSANDSDALFELKSSFTNTEALHSWIPDSPPCGENGRNWDGLICDVNGNVIGIHLGKMGLSGEINMEALMKIPNLRTLYFVQNSFSGSIPEFNRLGALKAVYLSENHFSGEISPDFFEKMGSLKKLYLDYNKFSGKIPTSLLNLDSLIELHLENNEFKGEIPSLGQPLVSFNVSNNELEGEIPKMLSRFEASSFMGNVGLCGEKIGKGCEEKVELQLALKNSDENDENDEKMNENENNTMYTAGGLTLSAMAISIAIVLIVKRLKKTREDNEKSHKSHKSYANEESIEVHVNLTHKGSSHGNSCGLGELVIINGEKGVFGLPDLMAAAAEMLGNGGLGSSYKAVLLNGIAVVVKRMKEMNGLSKDEFESHIKRLGMLKHPNVLTPLAFHYRNDEKLLVSEFIPRGNLFHLLHGERGKSDADLNWPTRLKIVQGIARGMGYLHSELGSYDLPHGNLKSSNVLLGNDYEPLLVEYGFSALISSANPAQKLSGYKAPEVAQNGEVTPKCDVYCLGVIILEILTCKYPSQFLSNGKGTDVVQWVTFAIAEGRETELLNPEIASSTTSLDEMQQLQHIGIDCTENDPEKRLDMNEAIRRIQAIKSASDRFKMRSGRRTSDDFALPSLTPSD